MGKVYSPYTLTRREQKSNCQYGVWKSSIQQLERMVWNVISGRNYGDACQTSLTSSGLINEGWIATGSDACTEDDEMCSTDNVKCFAVKLR